MSTEHVPDPDLMRRIGEAEATNIGERTYAAYLAVSLIGQRTPEEIIILADYLRTGEAPTMR